MINILKKLWLSEDEAKIYLFLIKNQNKNLWEISKNTLLNRPKLYKILPNMLKEGILSSVINWKRTHYIAQDPQILSNYFTKFKNDFELFLPQITKEYKNQDKKIILKNIKWKSWIKNIFLDIAQTLNKWDIFYRYSSRSDIKNTSLSKKDYEEYKVLREQKKLERYVITSEFLEWLKPKRLEKDVVIIPPKYDLFQYNITKIIYANKVAIIDYNTYESFIIENEVFATFERKIFMMLFKLLKKTS